MADVTLTWVQKHEKPVICALILAVLLFLGNKFLNSESAKADARDKAAQQTLAAQKEANDKLAVQNQEAASQYQVILGQLNTQNAKLLTQITSLSQSLVARQKQDAALTLPELALRHQALLGVSAGVSSTENGFLVSSPVETQTVQQLESLPVIKQQLSDETTLAGNKDKQITGLNGIITGLNGEVTGLGLQLTDTSKACDTRVAAVKKSRWKWFKYGLITGFLGGAYVGHKIP